jgi:hypothetical protein
MIVWSSRIGRAAPGQVNAAAKIIFHGRLGQLAFELKA